MGAFTGEIACNQLLDLGLSWVILGHSERRQFYHEDNQIVGEKCKVAIDSGMLVIGCIGEHLTDREEGNTMQVVQSQLDCIINSLSSSDWNSLVIAYEPVWAIGTGKVATPAQA